MKKLVIVVLLLLVVGAGLGAGWWFFLREQPEATAEAEDEQSDNAPVRLFVDFDPLIVSVIRDGRVIQHLTFTIILELKTDTGWREAHIYDLRLKDAFRTELHSIYSRRIIQSREDAMLILGKRLKTVAEELLGEGSVDRVLVNIMTRREFEAS